MTKNSVENWQRRLAGEVVTIHDGFPDYGFYRVRSRDKTSWRAVAYWYDDDRALRCRMDSRDLGEQQAQELWSWASRNPITHELYVAVTESGAPWPDLNEAVTRSNNAPADNSFEVLQERIDDMAREAGRFTEIKTQDEANQAADVANKLGQLQTEADTARADEKRPHDEAVKAVQAKWRPLVDAADAAKRRIKSVIATYLAAKETAERQARVEAAKAGAPTPEQPQRVSTTKAGTRGRAVSLRTVKDIEITDRAAVLAFFAEGAAMTAFLQDVAEKAVRAGAVVPGTKITERKIAA